MGRIVTNPFLLLFVEAFFLDPMSLVGVACVVGVRLLVVDLLFVAGNLYTHNLSGTFRLLPRPRSIRLLPKGKVVCASLGFMSTTSSALIPVLKTLASILPHTKRIKGKLFLRLSRSGIPSSPRKCILRIGSGNIAIVTHARTKLFCNYRALRRLLRSDQSFSLRVPRVGVASCPTVTCHTIRLSAGRRLSQVRCCCQVVSELTHCGIGTVV